MNNEETTKLQIKNILADLRDDLRKVKPDFKCSDKKYPIKVRTFSFNSYTRDDLIVISEFLIKDGLGIYFNDLFLNNGAYNVYINSRNPGYLDIEIGYIESSDIIKLQQKINKLILKLYPEEVGLKSKIREIIFMIKSDSQGRKKELKKVKINGKEILIDRKDSVLLDLYEIYNTRTKVFPSDIEIKKLKTKINQKEGKLVSEGFPNCAEILEIHGLVAKFKDGLVLTTEELQ